ncbi:MAG: HDOD domain-containing protein [Massilia sp.]
MGGSDGGASESAVPAKAGEQKQEQAGRIGHDIDAAYYRWLTGSARFDAAADVENAILDKVRALAARPDEASGLVPRVPEVIPQLLGSLGDEDVSTGDLSRLVLQDPVLVAEVIREANSAYYRPMTKVDTVEAAIRLLGQNGLRMVLARVAFRPVINMESDGFARRVAPLLWDQSERCALAASLVAPGLPAGAFEAYLAGLIQNVGLIVAFRLCPQGAIPASAEFSAELLALGRQMSAGIARHWAFPADVTQAIEQAGAPDASNLARALAQGDRIAKLRLLVDAGAVAEDDALVTDGLDSFQRRCLGKLAHLES